jgi:hypothetical protein
MLDSSQYSRCVVLGMSDAFTETYKKDNIFDVGRYGRVQDEWARRRFVVLQEVEEFGYSGKPNFDRAEGALMKKKVLQMIFTKQAPFDYANVHFPSDGSLKCKVHAV